MDGNPNTTSDARVAIGDTVTFVHQAHTWTGTVVKKHRVSNHVVCGHQRGFRIPYTLLTIGLGIAQLLEHSHIDHRRALFHAGEQIQLCSTYSGHMRW